MTRPASMSVEDLRSKVDTDVIDTVVVAFPDMQGRLQGKRMHARFFLDTVLEHGTEGCNYLLAVDVDMNTVEGYAISSWERGYGDFEFVLDLSTLRPVPWLPGTAMVLCDLTWLSATTPRSPRARAPSSAASSSSAASGRSPGSRSTTWRFSSTATSGVACGTRSRGPGCWASCRTTGGRCGRRSRGLPATSTSTSGRGGWTSTSAPSRNSTAPASIGSWQRPPASTEAGCGVVSAARTLPK